LPPSPRRCYPAITDSPNAWPYVGGWVNADTDATREDNQKLMEALGSTAKEYVEIPGGGHFLHFEKVNTEFYQAVQDFLEAEK
jgi:alpha-beta hydrolase superfamily lysophospholipase